MKSTVRLLSDCDAIIRYLNVHPENDERKLRTVIESIIHSLSDYAHAKRREEEFHARDTD